MWCPCRARPTRARLCSSRAALGVGALLGLPWSSNLRQRGQRQHRECGWGGRREAMVRGFLPAKPFRLPKNSPTPSHSQRPFRVTPCRFYAIGRCRDGDACSFKHIPRGTDRSEPDVREKAATTTDPRGRDDGSGAAVVFRKTSLCKFYEEYGSCAAGRECRFAHGKEELRSRPASPPPRSGPAARASLPEWAVDSDGDGGDATAWPPRELTRRRARPPPPPRAARRGGRLPEWAASDDGRASYYDGDDDDDDARPYATALGASRAARLSVQSGAAWKTRLCKFWQECDCIAGDACSFAHGSDEIRRFGGKKETPVVPPGLGKSGGGGGATTPTPKPDKKPPSATAKAKTKMCWHWKKRGTCPDGDACGFAHGFEELKVGRAAAAAGTPLRPPAAATLPTTPPQAEATPHAPLPPRGLTVSPPRAHPASPPPPPPLALDPARGPPAPPPSFVCPLTGAIMADPVVAADGYTYERRAVEDWLNAGHDESPITLEPLLDGRLVPNHALRSAIAATYGVAGS